jgi:hypothetical protein
VGADEEASREAVNRLLANPDIEAVVHNDLTAISPARHGFAVHYRDQPTQHYSGAQQLAKGLAKMMEISA